MKRLTLRLRATKGNRPPIFSLRYDEKQSYPYRKWSTTSFRNVSPFKACATSFDKLLNWSNEMNDTFLSFSWCHANNDEFNILYEKSDKSSMCLDQVVFK